MDYLSNEIFYRIAKLGEEWIKSKLPTVLTKATGHFHIAMLQTHQGQDLDIGKTRDLLNTVKTAIDNGINGL